MSREPWRFRFTSGSGGRDTAGTVITLSERDYRDQPMHLELLAANAGPPPDWARDLMTVARAVHLVDRRVPRGQEPDRWTRRIDLSVQLLAPERWTVRVRDELGALLSTLTGDAWHVTMEGGAIPPHDTLLKIPEATEVALFSGGLDSTCFAAERSSAQSGPLFLVTCGQTLLTHQVEEVHHSIQAGRSRCVKLRRMPLLPRARDRELDLSNRSRGLVFAACAVVVAAAQRLSTVSMPENGQLAANPPLTMSRLGACSTRSVHPWVLDRVNRLITEIGGDVRVRNPLVGRTKGEVCAAALATGLSSDSLARTVSCAHPISARRGSTSYHCGSCFPCLIRRSGMHRALGHDPTHYRSELPDIALEEKGSDLRAIVRWLSRPFSVLEVVADMPLPDDTSSHDLVPVLHRGRHELATMIEHSLPPATLRSLAWDPQP